MADVQQEEETISVEPILVVPARKPTAGKPAVDAIAAMEKQPAAAAAAAAPQQQQKNAGGGAGGNKSTQRRNSGGARQHQWTQKKANTVGGGDGGAANDRNRKQSEDRNRKQSEDRNRKQSEQTQEGGGGATTDTKKVGRSRENSAKDTGKKSRNQSDSGQQEHPRPAKGKENEQQAANGHAAAAPRGSGGDDKSAADRRNSYKQQRVFSASKSNKSTEKSESKSTERRPSQGGGAGGSGGKRVFSKSLSQDHGPGKKPHDKSAVNGEHKSVDGKKRTGSTASNGKLRSQTSEASANGESFDYEGYDLEEPFSDSEDETPRAPLKPSLSVPRGRIRTLSGTIPVVGFSPKWGGPTMCLSCLQFFDLPDMTGKFAEHLLQEHHIVIEEVDLIVDPKRYVEHWRQRFAKESVDKIFPKIVPDENNPLKGKVEYYFEMSERIPEDYALRQRLAMRRLEEALSCQQREREETNFRMPCIFCRYTAKGNRSKIIHHLYMIHHLNLGSPDNLVFVAEYIDHLKEKLNRNECIYCEKTFADRNTLMDHMRKRNHREVNPKNNYYDKFYIINYLELGKRWLDVLAEDFEDTMPTFADSDDEEEEESWHEWQEDNTDEDELRVVCLFCEDSHETVEHLLAHFSEAHKFDFLEYIRENKLSMYDRLKLLVHLRKETFNKREYRQRAAENELKPAEIPERDVWDKEENLVPMFDNDHLLWTLESFLDEKHPELAAIGWLDDCEHAAVILDNKENAKPEKFARQDSTLVKRDIKEVIQMLIADAKRNTVEGVEAEDWPDMSKSALADAELYKSLR